MPETSLRERALRHLARRDHSRVELARKLAAHGSADEIEAVIARMGELGLQSDTRYAEAFVRGKAERFGAGRLRSELSLRGVAGDLIDEAIASECSTPKLSVLERCFTAVFPSLPPTPANGRGRPVSCKPAALHLI